MAEAVDEDGKFFGEEGALAAMGEGDHRGPEEICQQIWEAVQTFQGAVPQDDTTLLAIRASRGQPS